MSLSNISRVFLREKLVYRKEMKGKVQYPFTTKWFTQGKSKILNCYYGIVGCATFEIQPINSIFVFVSFFQVMP